MNFSRDPSAVFGANSERPYGSITRGVAIHPFLNGNGRWARMLANIWLKRNGHPITEWPEATISFKSVIRDEYLAAIRLHARRIVRTFAKATAERKIPPRPMGGCSSAEMADAGIILSRSAGMRAASLTWP